jgi:PPOX class probable F420-dependent enzyme
MDIADARRRVESARVGRLGTVTAEGKPHLVPCCFVLREDLVYTAVDAKPKSSLALRRIDNISAHRWASLLVDHYEEDWSELWWVRLDGTGRVVDSGDEAEQAKRALAAKYPQYENVAIPGPVIGISVKRWRSWP